MMQGLLLVVHTISRTCTCLMCNEVYFSFSAFCTTSQHNTNTDAHAEADAVEEETNGLYMAKTKMARGMWTKLLSALFFSSLPFFPLIAFACTTLYTLLLLLFFRHTHIPHKRATGSRRRGMKRKKRGTQKTMCWKLLDGRYV